MTAVNFNMRLDSELKAEAEAVLENYGLSVPQALKLFLNQVVKTHAVPLSFDWGKENKLTPKAEARLLESMQDMENGKFVMFDSVDALVGVLSEKNA